MIGPVTSRATACTASEVATRCGRKAGLDHVHAEIGERAGDPQLLWQRHAASRRLLAVAQRGVENQHTVRVVSGHDCSGVKFEVKVRESSAAGAGRSPCW